MRKDMRKDYETGEWNNGKKRREISVSAVGEMTILKAD